MKYENTIHNPLKMKYDADTNDKTIRSSID